MEEKNDSPIEHVSDTAIWVATFRARESEKRNGLFKDPLARVLVGEKGEEITAKMPRSTQVKWSVTIRTIVIDKFIQEAVAHGVDTVLNLGAGLDTRPYRMDLPADLNWIEVDYPSIVDLKNEKLKTYPPKVKLQRIAQDLADVQKRRELLSSINAQSKRVLILTEGVLPYLSNESVASLAADLRAQDRFTDWIAEYYAPFFMEMVRKYDFNRLMKNAPFQFDPKDWMAFFAEQGWRLEKMRYLVPEGIAVGRYPPGPFLVRLFSFLIPKKKKEFFAKISGYALLRRG